MSRLDVSYSYTQDLEKLPCQARLDHLEQNLRVESQTLVFCNNSPKGLQRCEPLLSEASLPGGTAGVFIFFSLLIFSFSPVNKHMYCFV